MTALWRIVLMRFGRSPSGILACLPQGEKGGSKAELLKISRKADRDAPCDQARMLDSVRTEVLHDAKPTNERRLALGLRPKPHLFFCKEIFLQTERMAFLPVIFPENKMPVKQATKRYIWII